MLDSDEFLNWLKLHVYWDFFILLLFTWENLSCLKQYHDLKDHFCCIVFFKQLHTQILCSIKQAHYIKCLFWKLLDVLWDVDENSKKGDNGVVYRKNTAHALRHGAPHTSLVEIVQMVYKRCILHNNWHLYFYFFFVQILSRNAWGVFSALCKTAVRVKTHLKSWLIKWTSMWVSFFVLCLFVCGWLVLPQRLSKWHPGTSRGSRKFTILKFTNLLWINVYEYSDMYWVIYCKCNMIHSASWSKMYALWSSSKANNLNFFTLDC